MPEHVDQHDDNQPWHSSPLETAAPPPSPGFMRRYGPLGPLHNAPPLLGIGGVGQNAQDHSAAPNLIGLGAQVKFPPAQEHPITQLDEHEQNMAELPHADPGGLGEVAATLETVHGVLLNILDAIRSAKPRDPIYYAVSVSSLAPAFLYRRGRRHLLLWMPTTPPTLTLSGQIAPTTLTPKVGWNVIDLPDGTELTGNNAVPVAIQVACVDEVPPGLINN